MVVLEVRDVSKKFRLYQEKRPTLKEKILFKGQGSYEEFWALKNINLKIEHGKTVGLIGQNGSGKSTLLKLLTRIIYPTTGTISIKGRVSSLLELGAGFHPDFTGRENIYMNASIFGLKKREIDSRIDQIIDFSELGEFIDNPVRSYSSGMYMRLAFATAINVDPDVLLIDEVLAVGDSTFQKKCLNKINEFKSKGKTIVLVSHDHGIVEKLCDTAVWLHEGHLMEVGKTVKVIDSYLTKMVKKNEDRLLQEHQKEEEEDNEKAKEKRWGSGEIEIVKVEMIGSEKQEKYYFEIGEPVDIKIHYKVSKQVLNPVFGIGIFRSDGLNCYGTNTLIENVNIDYLKPIGSAIFSVNSLNLLEGKYTLDVAIHSQEGPAYDYITGKCNFEVSSRINDVGVARIPHKWIINGRKVLE